MKAHVAGVRSSVCGLEEEEEGWWNVQDFGGLLVGERRGERLGCEVWWRPCGLWLWFSFGVMSGFGLILGGILC